MTTGFYARCTRLAGAAATLALMAAPAFAADAPPVPNKGDTAFMMICSVLVLLMTVPGLALFYGGLVHKNQLSCWETP